MTHSVEKDPGRRPTPCEHETQGSEQPETCAYCKYLADEYDGWEPWEDATWG